jgi:hypothetical protein
MDYQLPLSEKDCLRLIQEMIGIAKQEQKDDGRGWILWGWLLLLASICSLLSNLLSWSLPQYTFWNAFGIISIIYFIYIIVKYFFFRKKADVKTYTKDILHKLNLGFIISMFFIIVTVNLKILEVNVGFILLINLYGFRILMQGSALNFRPFIIGAVICWVMALVGLFFYSYNWIMAVHAIAVLFGYIIPGHLANQDFNKTKITLTEGNQYSV